MYYLANGVIKEIGDTMEFKNNFKKREFFLEVDGKDMNILKLDFLGDDVSALDKHKVDDKVTVGFIVKGNEYNGKVYTNLQAIGIGKQGDSGKAWTKLRKEKRVVIEEDDDKYTDLPF